MAEKKNQKKAPGGASGKGLETSCATVLPSVKDRKDKLNLLERAIFSARNGIVITDPRQDDNPIIYVNPGFLELTGYDAGEVLGLNCRFLQGDDRRQAALDVLREALKEEKPTTVVLRNYRKNGELFWNELTVSPVHDENGVLTNFVGIQNDITARIEAETRISEFYSMISHELRTPLTSIRASLGLIEEGSAGPVTSEAAKLVGIAYRNTDRLLRLVSDILDFRKIESGTIKLVKSKIIARELIEQVVSELRSTASEKRIGFAIGCASGSIFRADRDRIAQVLTNLAANAIKFAPEGSTVKIDCFQARGSRAKALRFEVTDEGPGIASSDQSKLFQKFRQLDASDTRKKGGTGLGLAISKSLVEMHGGIIGLDSKLGTGSCFWFEIPVSQSAVGRR
ncbi:MAG: PAS domain-containing protein [Candidatus Melainabacteria bacterium]|nr:PAS domain-containing protein [Candidatus Melainabacteria bacterium]